MDGIPLGRWDAVSVGAPVINTSATVGDDVGEVLDAMDGIEDGVPLGS